MNPHNSTTGFPSDSSLKSLFFALVYDSGKGMNAIYPDHHFDGSVVSQGKRIAVGHDDVIESRRVAVEQQPIVISMVAFNRFDVGYHVLAAFAGKADPFRHDRRIL